MREQRRRDTGRKEPGLTILFNASPAVVGLFLGAVLVMIRYLLGS